MDRNKKSYWVQTLLLAFVTAFFFSVVLPVQSYLGSRNLFDFGFWELLCAVLPIGVALFAVLVLLLWLSDRLFARWLHIVVFAILVCEYLETGILSVGLPALDGDLSGFGNPFRKIIDSSIIVFVFLAVVAAGRWIRPVLHWVSVGCLVMFTAALMDVQPQERASDKASTLASGFCPNYDAVMSFRYSPVRNVMVLMLDSAPATLMAELVRENPEFKKHFPGFVAYDNNIGMHYQTRRGLPGLMTGQYLEADISASDYTMSVYGTNSILYEAAIAGCHTYFSGSMLPMGYTNKRLHDSQPQNRRGGNESGKFVLSRESREIPYISLREVLVCRVVPYFFKGRVLKGVSSRLFQRNVSGGNPEEEAFLYPLLANAAIENEPSTNLFVAITHGVHPPIMIDKKGERLSSPRNNVEGLTDLAYFRLTQLGEMFDTMRRRGVYDNTFIIATTDHGCIFMKTNNVMHGAESAMLWVKPFSETNEFRSTNLPTSHCKIAQLINSICVSDLDQSDIDAILKTDKRLFRAKHGSTWYSMGKSIYYYDWLYDAEGKLLSYEKKGVFKAN